MILSFMPSEIARLILGYLKERRYLKTVGIFLAECADLREYVDCLQMGKEYPTSIGGKNLLEILDEYCAMAAVENCKLSIDAKQVINKLEVLLTQIKYLLLQSNNGNSHNIQMSTIDHHTRKQQSNTRLSLAASRKDTAKRAASRSNYSTSSVTNHLNIRQEVDITENSQNYLPNNLRENRLSNQDTSDSVVPVVGETVEDLTLDSNCEVMTSVEETLRDPTVSLTPEVSTPVKTSTIVDKTTTVTSTVCISSTNSERLHSDEEQTRQSQNVLSNSVLDLQPKTFIEISTPSKERLNFEDGQFRSPRRKCHPPKKRSGVAVQTTKRIVHDEDSLEDHSEESLDLSVFLEQLITNTALHERIAENINKVVGCNTLEPMEVETENIPPASNRTKEHNSVSYENAASLSQISAKELYMPETLIKDILNRTESDPVFEDFIHGCFDKIEVCSASNDGCTLENTQQKVCQLSSSEIASQVEQNSGNLNDSSATVMHSQIQSKENPSSTKHVGAENTVREATNAATCSVLSPSTLIGGHGTCNSVPSNADQEFSDENTQDNSAHTLQLCSNDRTSIQLNDSQSISDKCNNNKQLNTSFSGISSSLCKTSIEVPSKSTPSANLNKESKISRNVNEQQDSIIDPGNNVNINNEEIRDKNQETSHLSATPVSDKAVGNVITLNEAAFVVADKDVSASSRNINKQVTESNNLVSNTEIENAALVHNLPDSINITRANENADVVQIQTQEIESSQSQNNLCDTAEGIALQQNKETSLSLEANPCTSEKVVSSDVSCVVEADPNADNQIISLALTDSVISELQQNNMCHFEYTDAEGRIIRIQALGAWYNELPSSVHQIVGPLEVDDASQQVHVTVTPVEILPASSSSSSQEEVQLLSSKEAVVNNQNQSELGSNSTGFQYLTLSPNHLYSAENSCTMALASNCDSNKNQVTVVNDPETNFRLKKMNHRRKNIQMKIKNNTKAKKNYFTTKGGISRLQHHVVRILDMGGPTEAIMSEQNKDSDSKAKPVTNSTSNQVASHCENVCSSNVRASAEKSENRESTDQGNTVVSDSVSCSTKEITVQSNSNNTGKDNTATKKMTKKPKKKVEPKPKKATVQKTSTNCEHKNSDSASTNPQKLGKNAKNYKKSDKAKKSRKSEKTNENIGPVSYIDSEMTTPMNSLQKNKHTHRANILSRKNKLLQSPQLKNLISSARNMVQRPKQQESHVRVLNFGSPPKQSAANGNIQQERPDIQRTESVIYYTPNAPLSRKCNFVNLYQMSKRMRTDSEERDERFSLPSNINVTALNEKQPQQSKALKSTNPSVEKPALNNNVVQELSNGLEVNSCGSSEGSPTVNEVAVTLVSLGEQISKNVSPSLPLNLSKRSANKTALSNQKRKREEEEKNDKPQEEEGEETGEAHTLLVGMDVDKFLSKLHYVE